MSFGNDRNQFYFVFRLYPSQARKIDLFVVLFMFLYFFYEYVSLFASTLFVFACGRFSACLCSTEELQITDIKSIFLFCFPFDNACVYHIFPTTKNISFESLKSAVNCRKRRKILPKRHKLSVTQVGF